jgi:hypothetical protein
LRENKKMADQAVVSHRFAGGPSEAELREWVQEHHWTDEQIAAEVGRRDNVPPPSKQTVAYWRRKHNIPASNTRHSRKRMIDHSEWRPWRVKMEHVGDGIEHRLYEYSYRKNGVKLSAAAERRLDRFLAFLEDEQLVVDYDREEGWLLRRRDAALDAPGDIIRRPGGKRTGSILVLHVVR